MNSRDWLATSLGGLLCLPILAILAMLGMNVLCGVVFLIVWLLGY